MYNYRMKQFVIMARYSALQIINILLRDRQRFIFWLLILTLPFIVMGSAASSVSLFKTTAKLIPINPLLNFFAFTIFILFGFSASTNLFITVKSVFNSTFTECIAPLPINTPALFAAKIFEMVFNNYIDLAFCMPMFFSLAYMLGAGFWQFIAAAAVFFAFEALICFGVLSVALLMARLFTKRAADFFTWCVGVFFVIAFILIQNYPAKLFKMPEEAVKNTLKLFESAYFEYLPTRWIINIVYGLIAGDYKTAVYGFIAFALLLAFFGGISYHLFKLFFRRGVEMQSAVTKSAATNKTIHYKRYSSFFTLLKKEFYCVLRNSQIIYSLFMMPAIFFIFTYLDFSFGNMGAFTFLIFTVYLTSVNSALFCFGVEGTAIMVYKSLPIAIEKIYWAKYITYGSLNLAAALLCFVFAVKFSGLPSFIDPAVIFSIFVFYVLWLNLFICDFGFYFASYKPGGKLKNAVRIEGTFALIIVIFAVAAAAAFSLYKLSVTLLCATALSLIALQAVLHYLAVQNYKRGEF
jgi:hypothetical protein